MEKICQEFVIKLEVVVRCSVKKVLLEISQISQENTCASLFFNKKEALAQVFFSEFCKISKNTFFYRIPLVSAYVKLNCLNELSV